eukprot:4729497-Amphidinium_carterae.1
MSSFSKCWGCLGSTVVSRDELVCPQNSLLKRCALIEGMSFVRNGGVMFWYTESVVEQYFNLGLSPGGRWGNNTETVLTGTRVEGEFPMKAVGFNSGSPPVVWDAENRMGAAGDWFREGNILLQRSNHQPSYAITTLLVGLEPCLVHSHDLPVANTKANSWDSHKTYRRPAARRLEFLVLMAFIQSSSREETQESRWFGLLLIRERRLCGFSVSDAYNAGVHAAAPLIKDQSLKKIDVSPQQLP